MSDVEKDARITFRVPQEIAERMAMLAAMHGHRTSAELRLAWTWWSASATLVALQDPEAKAELGSAWGETLTSSKMNLELLSCALAPERHEDPAKTGANLN